MAVKNFYSCGPTVYDYAHIGNFRAYITADLYYRYLVSQGVPVDWVMNITDVDDKTISGTIKQAGLEATPDDLKRYTERFFELFVLDLKEVGVDETKIRFIKVAEVIPQIQEFIMTLIEKGYAYTASDGSTYFSIERYQQDFGDYGSLVGENFLHGKKLGARIDNDEYDKENLSDFALWKAHNENEARIFWDHPTLGPGRPGWHIECSVINKVAFNSAPTDVHSGGVDLIFPHHTNEIAQSQPLYQPFVRQWLHSEHLLVDGKKMSKSLGNFYRLADLKERGFDPLVYRYLLLNASYKSIINFTWEALEGAQNAHRRLKNAFLDLPGGGEVNEAYWSQFSAALADDLNTPQALALAWKLLDDESLSPGTKRATLEKFDTVLGLSLSEVRATPAEVQELVDKREAARQAKDFATADTLRTQITALGFDVKDTPDGPKIYPL